MEPIKKILAPKMIFIAGPRQSGKTTLIKHLLDKKSCSFLFLTGTRQKSRQHTGKTPSLRIVLESPLIALGYKFRFSCIIFLTLNYRFSDN